VGGAVALAVLAGCGKGAAHPAGPVRPTAGGSQAAVGRNVPTDCRTASGSGADAAAYAASLVLGVDYREYAVLPQVVKPLVTSGFDTNLAAYLRGQQKTIAASKLRQVVTSASARYVSGSCATPVYAVALERQTTTSTAGVQTGSVSVRATLVWSGSAYLLQTLASG
jgi:hypothetical protein